MNGKYIPPYRQGNLFRPRKKSGEAAPETRYRALSGLAIVSVGLGALSALTFLGWSLAVVPLTGMAVGWIALRRIQRNPEELTGKAWAYAGMALSLVLWVSGYTWQYYLFSHFVPPGYEAIDYARLQPDPNDREQRVSRDAEMWDKRKVFVRGYMSPGKQKSAIREFVLLDDPGACSFCGPTPKPTQLIRVKLTGGMKLDYTSRAIGVGGEFTIHTDPKEEGMGGLVYQIEADCLR
jgi:hypothetical protein